MKAFSNHLRYMRMIVEHAAKSNLFDYQVAVACCLMLVYKRPPVAPPAFDVMTHNVALVITPVDENTHESHFLL